MEENKIKRVEREEKICRVATDDNLPRREIRLNFLHNYYASADGRIWKRRALTAKNGEVWKEVTATCRTAKHKRKQVNICDKRGKKRQISRAFLVLCAYRGYAGKYFYAAHLGDRADDSLSNLRWKWRQTRTKHNKRNHLYSSFFDILQDDEKRMQEWMEALKQQRTTSEAREWNIAMLERFEREVNGGKRVKF